MILNLTQHNATLEQIEAGVTEPSDKKEIQDLLTFNKMPTREEILDRASKLCHLAHCYGADKVLIGGAPYLMGALEDELERTGITPVYSFSERVSVEKTDTDGTVRKTNEFRHVGFVEV